MTKSLFQHLARVHQSLRVQHRLDAVHHVELDPGRVGGEFGDLGLAIDLQVALTGSSFRSRSLLKI